jgi:hypothetical protein
MTKAAATYLYGEVEDALMATFRVPEGNRSRFRARLRHFRNLGVPPMPRTGSGVKVEYTRTMIHELLIALELTATGLSPDRVVKWLNEYRDNIPRWSADCLKILTEDKDSHRLLSFYATMLGESTKGIVRISFKKRMAREEDDNPFIAHSTKLRSFDEMRDFLRGTPGSAENLGLGGDARRAIVFNLSASLEMLMKNLPAKSG